jgi:putative transposase
MTVTPSIDGARLLEEQLAQASPDLLRELLTTFINTLMSAEADAVCGAAYGTVSEDRINRRNGYRSRDFDTRAGTLDLAVPKLRQATYFPDWLLERRKRAERALTSVVATCYLLGVSTRRMDKLVQSLGITTLSKSQVSEMAKDLDAHVDQFRTRRLEDAGPFTFLAPTRSCSRSAKVAASCPCTHSSRPVSTPTDTDKSSGSRSPPAKTAPAGSRSSGT